MISKHLFETNDLAIENSSPNQAPEPKPQDTNEMDTEPPPED